MPGLVENNSKLSKVIKIDPDNKEAWRVYANYLQTQNIPHGELIVLGFAIEKDPESEQGKDARVHYHEIFDAHKESWLAISLAFVDKYSWFGEATGFDDDEKIIDFGWKYGYLSLNMVV